MKYIVSIMAAFALSFLTVAPAFAQVGTTGTTQPAVAPAHGNAVAVVPASPSQGAAVIVSDRPVEALAATAVTGNVGCTAECATGNNPLTCSAKGSRASCTNPDAYSAQCTDGTHTTVCNCQGTSRGCISR